MNLHPVYEGESDSDFSGPSGSSFDTSKQLFAQLSELPLQEQINLAGCSRTSIFCLRELCKSKNYSVKEALLENSALPADVIYDLARDEDPDIRFLVASYPYIPGGILRELSSDENPFVSNRAMQTRDRIKLEVSKRRGYRECVVYLKQSQYEMVG